MLRDRLAARGDGPRDPEARRSARRWALERIDAAVAAGARQPAGTLLPRSDKLGPAELADEVLAALDVLDLRGEDVRHAP